MIDKFNKPNSVINTLNLLIQNWNSSFLSAFSEMHFTANHFSESVVCNSWNDSDFLYMKITVKPVSLLQPVMEEEE
jgi:hypothetical protein